MFLQLADVLGRFGDAIGDLLDTLDRTLHHLATFLGDGTRFAGHAARFLGILRHLADAHRELFHRCGHGGGGVVLFIDGALHVAGDGGKRRGGLGEVIGVAPDLSQHLAQRLLHRGHRL